MLMNDDDSWEYLTMQAEELQKLRPSFKEYTKNRFKEYVITLKDEVMKINTDWPHPWDRSNAKDYAKSLLMKDFDQTYHSMDLKTFWDVSPLFEEYPLENFEKYLRKMKKAIGENKGIIDIDEANLRNDRSILPPKTTTEDGKPRWDRHVAKKLLKADIIAKKNETMKPKQLLSSRKEYQDFVNAFSDLRIGEKCFRKHIFQAVYGQNQSAYWEHKAMKKREEKEKISKLLEPFTS